ncbi:uncharacterized protein LOC117088041 [Trachypithecus francoisi]|uniref:uncharacterized protein LOC117088041 n=1 Tax=Trachypithecus francoisi TaxID=54180 RepID=UPI00141A96B2|nr:uncharacterized protein LOC117088041 [Trachypithecus francoisi]
MRQPQRLPGIAAGRKAGFRDGKGAGRTEQKVPGKPRPRPSALYGPWARVRLARDLSRARARRDALAEPRPCHVSLFGSREAPPPGPLCQPQRRAVETLTLRAVLEPGPWTGGVSARGTGKSEMIAGPVEGGERGSSFFPRGLCQGLLQIQWVPSPKPQAVSGENASHPRGSAALGSGSGLSWARLSLSRSEIHSAVPPHLGGRTNGPEFPALSYSSQLLSCLSSEEEESLKPQRSLHSPLPHRHISLFFPSRTHHCLKDIV